MAAATDLTKVKKIVFTSFGGGNDYANVQIKEEDYPKVENNTDVIIRIKAAGLNFAELLQRQGLYRPQEKVPYTPGYEGTGVVEAVGSEVKNVSVGDRVLAFNSHGIWKDVVCVKAENVLRIPDQMSFEDGAGLLVNYLTAYHLLFEFGNLRPGAKVLIHMAAGGVGMAATQLCKTVENVTVFGTASASKHDRIRENGVTHPIDYQTKNYVDEVKRISPEGIDIVLDPLNGEDSLKGYSLLKPLGRIVHYGAASMTTENRSYVNALKTWWKCLRVNSLELMSDNKSVSGYHLGVLLKEPSCRTKLIEDIGKLFDLYVDGKIKIVIDSKFPFSKLGEAMSRIHNRGNVGKIVLIPDSEFKEIIDE